MLRQARAYSNKQDFLLADALGLLSPRKNSRSTFKPSLLRTIQKGSVTEQYNELQAELGNYEVPKVDRMKQLDRLVMDLQSATKWPRNNVDEKNLMSHVRRLRSEDELVELLKLTFYQNRLTQPLLMRFVLNKSLQQLSRLPFDIMNLDRDTFLRNGWSDVNFVECRIFLLKKFHDLNKPLLIVKLLRAHCDEFLLLIQQGKLSPFYERIFWKFYFEYVQKDKEAQYVEQSSLRSAVLIWEVTVTDSGSLAKSILAHHQTCELQRLFFELVLLPAIQSLIASELAAKGSSPLLSSLKKVSSKYKLYDVDATDSVVARALVYSVIHRMEHIVEQIPNWRDNESTVQVMAKLRGQRSEIAEHTLEPQHVHALVTQ